MMSQRCHICGRSIEVESLERAELAGWSRSVAGWICESYDCYQSCDHQRVGLSESAGEPGSGGEESSSNVFVKCSQI